MLIQNCLNTTGKMLAEEQAFVSDWIGGQLNRSLTATSWEKNWRDLYHNFIIFNTFHKTWEDMAYDAKIWYWKGLQVSN